MFVRLINNKGIRNSSREALSMPLTCQLLVLSFSEIASSPSGAVCGFIGAGGNAGSAIAQAIFFTPGTLSTQDAFKWMVSTCCRGSYLNMN